MKRPTYYVSMVIISLFFVYPIVWSGWSSIRLGDAFSLDSYRKLANYGEGIGTYLTNTVILVLLTVGGTLIVATFAGYAFARFRFPGRGLLFVLILAILMVPYPTILIPLYVMLGWFGLQDSLIGLALVMIMFQLPFAVFMMRNAFESVPRTLDEAAMIDGCGSFRALTRVLLPAVVPGLVTVGLFAFLASWNDYVAPLILISSNDRFTLPVAVVNMRLHDFGAVDYPTMQAGVVFMALPCLAIFLLLQRYYVRGFMSGALRG
ncbi:sugar ABC transporter permease [Acrocarpospora pleiomorpha]|uniref:Sugar ABC transporter permease n=1 Tax=Acrocarpospora pleiomorpha TaxID=90975 RepID=A0A5M3XKY0_9ACTN|nr:carbohydrate ABC transporter permease [Acrocarpospora pleiomorpha]GES19803.1 sugar ABC transporter permease [Acrocarpospora pleiomorpha]